MPASPDEPGAHQVETGGARSVRIIGPYGTPTGLIGTYTATNAYSPPDTIESNGDGGFNPGQAVGKLEGVSYFQGASTNGWQGNGVGGVASYTVASTWSTATEQAPTATYTNPETGDSGTSSATYQTQGASMEQVEVRLQTNKEVEVDKPLSAVFVLTKTTTPMEGGTTSSEFAAVLRLTISSGKISNVCEVVSGTLPPDVTTQGGVVSMRSPAPVVGNTVSFALLPVEIDQQNYHTSEGISFCRWLDSFPGGSFDNQAADKDRDRFRIKIAGNIPNLTKAKIKATDLHGAVVDGQFVNKTTDGDYEVEMKAEGQNNECERMWVEVLEVDTDYCCYHGRLLNQPRLHSGISEGHELWFDPVHVFAVNDEGH